MSVYRTLKLRGLNATKAGADALRIYVATAQLPSLPDTDTADGRGVALTLYRGALFGRRAGPAPMLEHRASIAASGDKKNQISLDCAPVGPVERLVVGGISKAPLWGKGVSRVGNSQLASGQCKTPGIHVGHCREWLDGITGSISHAKSAHVLFGRCPRSVKRASHFLRHASLAGFVLVLPSRSSGGPEGRRLRFVQALGGDGSGQAKQTRRVDTSHH